MMKFEVDVWEDHSWQPYGRYPSMSHARHDLERDDTKNGLYIIVSLDDGTIKEEWEIGKNGTKNIKL